MTLGAPAAEEAAENIAAVPPIAAPTMSDICLEYLLKSAADGTTAIIQGDS
jgi:hypothetical protein